MAFCSPDLLDPHGWMAGDQAVVLKQVKATHRTKSPEAKVLNLRFGDGSGLDGSGDGDAPIITSQHELAEVMEWSPRRIRDTISRLLHSIRPVADSHVPLHVLYEDKFCIAVAKPAGVGVTPEHRLRGGSMLNRVVAHVKPRPRDAVPAPVHRLDLNTSGVLLFAKTTLAATKLMTQFEERKVRKVYAALCADRPRVDVVDAPLCRVAGAEHAVRRVCGPGEEAEGQGARSKLKVVAEAEAAAAGTKRRPCLVHVQPKQGRTHQVRVHCKEAGAAILADELYAEAGDVQVPPEVLSRHALHALSLECTHPVTGVTIELVAPLPDDMVAAAEWLGIAV